MEKEKFTWLIKRKSFVQLIGGEYHLLQKSGSGALLKFYIAAVTILLILALTICSIFYATDMLFHIPQIEVALAGFISALFVFIYIFLLNTFSKQVFTDKKNKQTTWWKKIRMANIVRAGFVGFMAFLIAKPVEIFIFRERLAPKLKAFKSTMLNSHLQKIKALNSADEQKIQRKLAYYKQQYLKYPSSDIDLQIVQLNNQLSELQLTEARNLATAKLRIERADFLLYRIQEVSSFPAAWLVCLATIMLFLVPGYLIYSISNNDTYYKFKYAWEKKLISEEYTAFCKRYTQLFKENLNLDRTYYSIFEDPRSMKDGDWTIVSNTI